MDLNRIKDRWEFPGKYIVWAVVIVWLLYALLIRHSSEYVLKRRMKVVETVTHVVEGQEILTEVVLRYGNVKFRLIDDAKDGYFPNDLDGIIDDVHWSRLRGAGGLKYRGKEKPYWQNQRLSQGEDSESYELATRKFLEAKERDVQLDDTIK